MNRTLVILKPNSVQRSLVGEIITRFEKRGLTIVALKLMQIDRPLAEQHYEEHKGKSFYSELIDFITSAPSVVMVLDGINAIEIVRRMCGETDPQKAAPGTIRADYGIQMGQNIIHASDSSASARREIGLFFRKEEILEYYLATHPWV